MLHMITGHSAIPTTIAVIRSRAIDTSIVVSPVYIRTMLQTNNSSALNVHQAIFFLRGLRQS